MKLKHNISAILLFTLVILGMGCKFPDNVPDLQNIKAYKLNYLKFGATNLAEFKKLTNFTTSEKVQNVTTINLEPENSQMFKNVRAGFRNNKLDWIEFTLTKEIKMTDFVSLYGQPRDINSTYSNKFNYFDYDFFNISTDKDNLIAKHITIFEIPKPKEEPPQIIEHIPGVKNINNKEFMGFEPGFSLESDFNSKYPFLRPMPQSQTSTKALYTIDKELGSRKSDYKLIQFYFNNGLLGWINLMPQNLTISEFIKIYGNKLKVENLNSEYLFYSNKNFALVVNKATRKIKTIGIISSEEK